MLSVWYDVCAGEVWTEGGFTHALFEGWGVGREVLLEQVQLNFSFRNKFIILLLCGLVVDNNTFSKMYFFDCNEWKTEECHECTNMGKVK
jgi:hypothetical protein